MSPAKETPGLSASGSRPSMAGKPFGVVEAHDELLHPVAADAGYATTETSYFGFNIPESAINGEIYVWFHPALRMMSASVYIWRGMKGTTLSCEYINHHHFLPFPEGDIDSFAIPQVGLRFKVIKPLKELEITCEDKARDMRFSLHLRGTIPPVGRPGGHHFTQPVKTDGELVLGGERYVIDGYFSRDRSWGEERHETARPFPPLTWMVGIFDDDFAFHALAFDERARSPEWVDAFTHPPEGGNLVWGYVQRDGEVFPVTRASKLTTRGADCLSPSSFDLEIDDAGGKTHAITGTVNARMPWQTWQNMNVYFCQTRWETAGQTGWGDAQDIQYNQFVNRFGKP